MKNSRAANRNAGSQCLDGTADQKYDKNGSKKKRNNKTSK